MSTNTSNGEPLQEEEIFSFKGCKGPDSNYVKLVASDGHVFIVKREQVMISGMIRAMLSGPGVFAENEINEINFKEIPSHVLQQVCLYFAYKSHYIQHKAPVPGFPISPENALELLMAANFFEC